MQRRVQPRAVRPPTEPLRALLTAYQEALVLERNLPIFVRRWFRPFAHLMLVNHIERRVADLHRRALAHSAVAADPQAWAPDLERLDRFQRSLPATRRRTWMVALLTVSFVAAWVLAGTVFHAQESAGLIEKITKATATVKPEGVIDAFDPPKDPPSAGVIVGAGWIAMYSVVLALLGPASSYRLKRALVTVAPRDHVTVTEADVTGEPDAESVVMLEEQTFAALRAHRPADRSLDLVAQVLLTVPVVGFGCFAVARVLFNWGKFGLGALIFALSFLVVGALSAAAVTVQWRARVAQRAAVPPEGIWRRPIALMLSAGIWSPIAANLLLIAALISTDVLR